jgi:hypothetical protein
MFAENNTLSTTPKTLCQQPIQSISVCTTASLDIIGNYSRLSYSLAMHTTKVIAIETADRTGNFQSDLSIKVE